MGVTDSGWLWNGPPLSEVGDDVIPFKGTRRPFILRPVGPAALSRYIVVGTAMVPGAMDGGVWNQRHPDLHDIVLV
jgi:hypothetical protein